MNKMNRHIGWTVCLAIFFMGGLITTRLSASVGDPQIKTTHPWNPGELSCSTFSRLWATEQALYTRETGRSASSDQDRAIAAWYWRNTHYYHSTEANEDIWGTGNANGEYARDFWRGLFGYGFGLCYATHAQFCGEMEYLIGHGMGRAFTCDGHTSFEVYLPSINDWAVLDHDISTIVFDASDTNLLSIQDINGDMSVLDNAGAPDHNQGWFISGLYYNSPSNQDALAYDLMKARMENFGYAGVPPKVHLRRGETFRRYLKPGLESGIDYVFWGINYNNGGIMGPSRDRTWVTQQESMYRATQDTSTSIIARNGNGIYTYTPDFSTPAYKDGVIDESPSYVTLEFYTPYVIGAYPPNTDLWGVYDPGCTKGLIITSSNTGTSVAISVDNGATWSSNYPLSGTAVDLTDIAKGHRSYQLKFNADAATLAGKNISIRTVVQANIYTMPHLVDGANTITYCASGDAVFAAGPNLPQANAFATSGSFPSSSPVTLTVPSPRGEKIKAVYADMWVASGSPPNTSCNYNIECSTDGGVTWKPIVSNWNLMNYGYDPGDSQSTSNVYGNLDISADNAASVQVRFSNDSGRNMLRGEVYIVYEDTNDSQTKVTFNYTDGSGAHTVNHTYNAGQTAEDSTWTFTAGSNTVTNWVEFECVSIDPTDTDGDGMPDAWENTYDDNAANDFDINNPGDAGLDFDGDGASNLHEYLAGTDPTDNGSVPDPGTQTSGSGTPTTVTMQEGVSGYAGTEDTYVNAINTTEVDGTRERLDVNWYEDGTLPDPDEHDETLIQFTDLSAIPAGATITDAKLTFWVCRANMATSADNVIVERVTSAWDEGTAWDSKPTSVSTGITVNVTDTVGFDTDMTDTGPLPWEVPGLTTIVQGWVDTPSGNHGLLFYNVSSNLNFRFCSSEFVDGDGGEFIGLANPETYRPKLEVTYTAGSTEPNAAPVISVPAEGATLTAVIGNAVSFTCTATDADDIAGDLTYAWDVDASDGMGFTDGSGSSFTYSGYAATGTYTAVVKVSDPHGGVDYATIVVTVTDMTDGVMLNQSALTFTADRSNYPGGPATQTVDATIIGSATVSAVTVSPAAPGWLVISNNAGGLPTTSNFTISVDPAIASSSAADGTYTYTVTVDSDYNDPTFTITVTIADYAGSADGDSDGMPDDWETAMFGNTSNTATGDFDNDGVSNLDEYTAGTNPTVVNGGKSKSTTSCSLADTRTENPAGVILAALMTVLIGLTARVRNRRA